jgi:protein O-mannosyl-transferase
LKSSAVAPPQVLEIESMSRHKKTQPLQPPIGNHSAIARSQLYVWFGLALVLLTTIIVYSPSLNGAILWDDDAHITRPELLSVGGLYRIWFELNATQQYYPLLHSAFWLEHKLWGDAVLGYHLVNVVWHSLAVVLVYLILSKLKIPGALLAASIFAVHPVMVESVAWISEQKNTLSAVFYLSAMLAYLHFDESWNPLPLGEGRVRASSTNAPLPQPSPKWRGSFYVLALGLFILGLLTKTVTATLPAALLVILWWQRGTLSWKRDVLPLVPFFVLGAVAGVLTAWVERKLIGAEGADFQMSIVERSLLAGRVIWFYLAKLIWPANLVFIYPRWQIDPAIWWQWIFSLAALAVTVALWAFRHTTRAPLAGWLLFCGTLFPVLGFLNVYPFIYSFVADHFQYLASLGMIVLASAAIAIGLGGLRETPRWVGRGICMLFVGGLAVLSWRQTSMYADGVKLYETTLARNPNCWMAHNNLGLTLAANGDPNTAIEHYQLAIGLFPKNAAAFNNLGNALTDAGRQTEAINAFREALTLKPDSPEFLNNFAVALMSANRFPEAIKTLEDAVRLRPDYADAHTNLGLAFDQSGKIPQAIEQYRQAVQVNQNSATAHYNLGNILGRSGDLKEALAQLQQAIQLQPDFAGAHHSLGDVLRKDGRLQEAIEQYQAARQLTPNHVPVYLSLVQALNLASRPEEAVAMAQVGIQVARVNGQDAAADQLEEWLKHYRKELERSSESVSSSGSLLPSK